MDRISKVWGGLLAASYLAADIALKPLAPRHAAFSISADTGLWAPTEFAHPLYVPLLAAVRALRLRLGFSGPILETAVLLNAVAGAACVWLYYALAFRLTGKRSVSVIAGILFGFSHGFWIQHIRPMPYAFATLLLLSSAWVALEARDRAFRPALLGLLAGLTTLMSLAGLALLPGLAVAVMDSPDATQKKRRLAVFSASAAAATAAGFVIFFRFHRIDPRSLDLRKLFFLIEQVPRSSLFTSRDLVKQLREFGLTFFVDFGTPFLLATAALSVLGGRPESRERNFLAALAVTSAAFAIFFILNNTHNALVFEAGVFLPLAAARGAASGPRARLALALLTVWTFSAAASDRALGRLSLSPGVDELEPGAEEIALPSRFLRADDLLVSPGKLDAAARYLFRFRFLETTADPLECGEPPLECVDEDLIRRLEGELGRGRRVLIASGGRTASIGALFDASEAPEALAATDSRLRTLLGTRFRLGQPLRSSSGQLFVPIALRGPRHPVPPDGYSIFEAGRALRATGMFREAASELARALELDPGLWRAREERGWCELSMRSPEAARQDFRAAAAEAPRDSAARTGLALALLDQGKSGSALAECRAARRADPDAPEGDECLAHVERALGRRGLAASAARRAVERYRELSNDWEVSSPAEAVSAGPNEEGLRIALRAVARGERDGSAWVSLGQAFGGLGRSGEAVWAYEKTLRLEPIGIPAAIALEELSRSGFVGVQPRAPDLTQ